MSIILPAVAVAFGAFCVWLTVRIVNRRERWAKRTAMALVAMVLYGLSVGPAARAADKGFISESVYSRIYAPIMWICDQSETCSKVLFVYVVVCQGHE